MEYKLFEVGGAVRDEFLGLKSKDIDYSVVLEDTTPHMDVAFQEFVKQIESEGYEVFLETPDCFTIRAKFPIGHKHQGTTADFVLARKELYYPETGRRPISKLGTLEDDLIRRDFTVNAMAKDELGNIIDPFGGYRDLMMQCLDTPTDPWESFKADPLRIIRGMRFCITKNLVFHKNVRNAIEEICMSNIEVVSQERVREELLKCFKFNTNKTLNFLFFMKNTLNFDIMDYVFNGTGIWLEPTNKT